LDSVAPGVNSDFKEDQCSEAASVQMSTVAIHSTIEPVSWEALPASEREVYEMKASDLHAQY